ncbi:MAG: MotA/TolQ/ExbB proton channel family protein [Bacteriovoracaceae bacterium]|jgi:chemotaxis protein MotA|nr:MotA/TolQ/ExbB proton channel family protein [Bacteriovoracaceae bacterium]
MNIYSIIGLLSAGAVLFFGFYMASNNMLMFLDYPSLFIVIGGTIAATAISFQMDRIIMLVKIFFQRIIKGKKYDYAKVIQEVMSAAESYRKGEAIENIASKAQDPFLKEGLELLSDGILDRDHMMSILEKRAQNIFVRYNDDAKKIQTIGKFPPAFGMMGTTIGMIVLLANLNGADAIKMIGPAMGVCLITTLYGVVIANLAIVPVSENLFDSAKEVYLKNQIIVEGIELIIEKTNPIIVAEELNSYLQPSERLDWKGA